MSRAESSRLASKFGVAAASVRSSLKTSIGLYSDLILCHRRVPRSDALHLPSPVSELASANQRLAPHAIVDPTTDGMVRDHHNCAFLVGAE